MQYYSLYLFTTMPEYSLKTLQLDWQKNGPISSLSLELKSVKASEQTLEND